MFVGTIHEFWFALLRRLAPELYGDYELLDDITMRFEPASEAAVVAEVDAELFERALANVLDNALKFTPAGKTIVLGLEVQGAEVRIAVRDEGCGIAAEDRGVPAQVRAFSRCGREYSAG